jgi:hypothetical protein
MVTFVTHSIPEGSLLADRVVMTPPGPRRIDLEFDERFGSARTLPGPRRPCLLPDLPGAVDEGPDSCEGDTPICSAPAGKRGRRLVGRGWPGRRRRCFSLVSAGCSGPGPVGTPSASWSGCCPPNRRLA